MACLQRERSLLLITNDKDAIAKVARVSLPKAIQDSISIVQVEDSMVKLLLKPRTNRVTITQLGRTNRE
jgi:hypothetical protein